MARKHFTIFDPTVSPQIGGDSVGIGDGLGAWLRVKDNHANPGNSETEKVFFNVTGSMNSATVGVVAGPLLSSPMVYGDMLNPKDDGTMVAVTTAVAGGFMVELPKGYYFTLEIASSGSPLPAIAATAYGEIEEA